jgi:23S rRNA (cytidine1920-2'-O)/16S rRNA (cytidine1409-2'-O)-methyltransferase
MKKRIDKILVERGLAESREKAQALIMAGSVLVNETPATKAGLPVSEDANVRLKEAPHPYVSRGGVKLEGAVESFGIHVEGKICLDAGCSTGGFTHFLLLNGAARVYALDVDVKQLDWKIRNDPRVRMIEMNARFLEPPHIGEPVDLVTMDVSFISLTMLLPGIPPVLKPGGECLALVKPQFEAGRDEVGKHGLVTDPDVHDAVIARVTAEAEAGGLSRVGMTPSPITGATGNREFFLHLRQRQT